MFSCAVEASAECA